MIKPLVSICCVTYNHEKFISQCLDGFIMQITNFNYEILVHEDASTDKTAFIVKEYESKYPHLFRCVYQNENQFKKVNTLTKILLPMARGRYIALCEGDDYWTDPLKLQKQVDFLENNQDCISCHHWQEIDVKNHHGIYERRLAPKIGHGYYPVVKADLRDIFANRLRIKTRTIMFRNVQLTFPDWHNSVAFGDVPLNMLLGKFGKFGFIDEKMAVYRQTGAGVSSMGKGHFNFIFNHYISWIKIWEHGNNYYQSIYRKEVLSTVLSFYKTIIRHYKFSPIIYVKLLRYCFFESEFSFPIRFYLFFRALVVVPITILANGLKRRIWV